VLETIERGNRRECGDRDMNVQRRVVEAVIVFSVTLVISMGVSVLWNLVVHKSTAIDWESSVRFAIVLGIVVPWIQARKRDL
jgi:hypothetical protein